MNSIDVHVYEVGPRDGLQNESQTLSIQSRIRLIELLAASGLHHIEVGSFVSPRAIPQLAGTEEVMAGLALPPEVITSALVLNDQGLERSLVTAVQRIAVVVAPSESFTKANMHCTVAESMKRACEIVRRAQEKGRKVRGYISCAVACPYEGPTDPGLVADQAASLIDAGCYEIALSDTIGSAGPRETKEVMTRTVERVPINQIAWHVHDTYGLALTSIYVALEAGVRCFDSSVAGLGGCPYAPGAAGNVATEDVVFMLHKLGMNTGIDLDTLLEAVKFVKSSLHREPRSRVAQARLGA